MHAQDELFDESLYERTRIVTVLTGSAYNGRALLAYGDGGVILRTTDWGTTWEQIDLPDSLHIVGIATAGRRFLGLCHRWYAIVSDDDGHSWQMRRLSDAKEFWRFVVHDGRYYGFTLTQLIEFDTAMNPINRFVLEPPASSGLIAFSRTHAIYTPGSGKLAVLDLLSRQVRTYDMRTFPVCSQCDEINDLAADQLGNIFFVSERWQKVFHFNLVEELITGTTTVAQLEHKPGKMHVRNGAPYILYTKNFIMYPFDTLIYVKCDFSRPAPTQISNNTSERYTSGVTFSDVNSVSGDTLVAVGPNKLIMVSFDGGVRWTLHSYYATTPTLVAESGRKIRGVWRGILCFSNDSGRTWRTQRTFPREIYHGSSKIWTDYYDDTDTCWLVNWYIDQLSLQPRQIMDSGLISFDGGNVFRWTYRPYANTIIDDLFPFRSKLGYNIAAKWYAPPGPNQPPIPWTVLSYALDGTLKYDKQKNVSLRNIWLYNIIQDGETLYAIGRDSITLDGNHVLYRSDDGGRRWEVVGRIDARRLGADTIKVSSLVFTKIGDDIFYVTRVKRDTLIEPIVVRYNLQRATISQASPPGQSILYANKPIWSWGKGWMLSRVRVLGRLRSVSEWLYCDNPEAESLEWRLLSGRRFYPVGEAFMVDSTYYVSVVDSTSHHPNFLALYRISKKTMLTVEQSHARGSGPSLWLSPSVPHPAQEKAELRLAYDPRMEPDVISVTVYSLAGERLSIPCSVQQSGQSNVTTGASPTLSIPCSVQQSGQGVAVITIDVHQLGTGAYAVVAEAGGQRVSRLLLVVR